MTEVKVKASALGAAAAAFIVGLLMQWLEARGILTPDGLETWLVELVAALLVLAGTWAAGWLKPSTTSGTSIDYSRAKAEQAHAKVHDA